MDAALDLHRIVELQAHTILRRLTDNAEEYEFIESLIESFKPQDPQTNHHYLIKTPFRYPLPVPPLYASRFKPPFYERNGFYGAGCFRTSGFEYGYHWLRQRVHIDALSQTPEPRTHFQTEFHDEDCFDLRSHQGVAALMDRKDYEPSHDFMRAHPEVRSLLYPSCRDPERGDCVLTFEIRTLGLEPKKERTLHLIYEASSKTCLLEDPVGKTPPLRVAWEAVR